MKSKTSFILIQAVFASVFFVQASSAAISLTATGIYDEPSNSNAVDSTAPGGAGTLATFKANITAAYAANLGGVITFDEITMPISPSTLSDSTLTVTYGASNSGILTITHNSTGGSFLFQANALLGTPISGGTYLRNGGTSAGTIGTHNYVFSIGLTELGFTVLSRNAERNITATVTYENGLTNSLSDHISAGQGGTDDTFFYFAASTSPIVSLTISDANTANFFAIDDLAFITVPEPSAAVMGALAACGLFARRRRKDD